MYGEYEQVNGAVANALQAEVDALRKDAARYRAWRKIVSTFPTCRPCNTPEQTAVRQMTEHDFLKESAIDAYIDAAIREQGANTKV